MNDRLFARLLLSLSVALVVTELLLAALYGPRLELIFLPLVLAFGLGGMLFSLRLLGEEAPQVESVSMRRQRAMQDEVMRERLSEYAVDEEFLGRKEEPRTQKPSAVAPASPAGSPKGESVEELVRHHAGQFGGAARLLSEVERLDPAAFERLMQGAGLSHAGRDEVIICIRRLVDEEGRGKADGEAPKSALECFSLDQESFDAYIGRCMGAADKGKEEAAAGVQDEEESFSVRLDASSLSQEDGTPPTDFSHNPRAIMERLRKAGEKL